jgi:ribonuclease HI
MDNQLKSVIKARRLPNNWSSQTYELHAPNQALKLLKDKEEAICMGSKYAFGVILTFRKIWMERGLINSRGKDIIHKELIFQVLDNLMLPEETAIVLVPGHQKCVCVCVCVCV